MLALYFIYSFAKMKWSVQLVVFQNSLKKRKYGGIIEKILRQISGLVAKGILRDILGWSLKQILNNNFIQNSKKSQETYLEKLLVEFLTMFQTRILEKVLWKSVKESLRSIPGRLSTSLKKFWKNLCRNPWWNIWSNFCNYPW